MDPRFVTTLVRHYPMIDAVCVGDEDAPSFGTLDPDILSYLAETQRTLVTDNRKSMPQHLTDHFKIGGHHWGVFIVSKHAPYKRVADALFVYWDVTEAEDWIDQVEWVAL